jgi:TetR/AcrR family transcriptional regulator, transcriptional repressor for nem operon
MARPKAFNRELALDQAMQVFWEQGFQATTMTELRAAMGIGRQSLYDTFGDKTSIFNEAFGRYQAKSEAHWAVMLGDADGMAALASFMHIAVDNVTAWEPRRGCLIFNTLVELAPHDAEVRLQVQGALSALQAQLEAALIRAQQQEKLPPEAAIHELAAFLTTTVGGLSVMAKSGASVAQLRATAHLALSALA